MTSIPITELDVAPEEDEENIGAGRAGDPTRGGRFRFVNTSTPQFATFKPARKVALVHSASYARVCDRIEADGGKYSLFTSLLEAYGLMKSRDNSQGGRLDVVSPRLCSQDQLEAFHSAEYIECVKELHESPEILDDYDLSRERFLEFGLIDDCYPFEGLYEYMRVVAGSSLLAAERLKDGYDIAMNFGGGRHHARREKAAGYCYVNDIVLAILSLLEDDKFQRILYIDLDIHHGDGVAEAFHESPNVFTLSIHHFKPGFYPGTGAVTDIGTGKGNYFNLNVPLQAGVTDQLFQQICDMIIPRIVSRFRPQAIVLCCGTDALSNDPTGCFNVTSLGYCRVVGSLLDYCIPTLVTGGGGYHPADCARTWATIVSLASQIPISPEIPEHDDYFKYKPGFRLYTRPAAPCLVPNMNNAQLITRLMLVSRQFEVKFSKNPTVKTIMLPRRTSPKPRRAMRDLQSPPQLQASSSSDSKSTASQSSPLSMPRRGRKRRRRAERTLPARKRVKTVDSERPGPSVYDFDDSKNGGVDSQENTPPEQSPAPQHETPSRQYQLVVPPTPRTEGDISKPSSGVSSPPTPVFTSSPETHLPDPMEEIPPTPSPVPVLPSQRLTGLTRQNAMIITEALCCDRPNDDFGALAKVTLATPAMVLKRQRSRNVVPPTPSEGAEGSSIPLPPPTPMDGCPGSLLHGVDDFDNIVRSSKQLSNITVLKTATPAELYHKTQEISNAGKVTTVPSHTKNIDGAGGTSELVDDSALTEAVENQNNPNILSKPYCNLM